MQDFKCFFSLNNAHLMYIREIFHLVQIFVTLILQKAFNKVVFKKTVPRHTWTQSCTTWCILNSYLEALMRSWNLNSFTDAMPKWSLTRLSYSLCSCWSPGYLVSVLTSHSLTCSAVLVHTTFGFLPSVLLIM